jgi:phospholipase C
MQLFGTSSPQPGQVPNMKGFVADYASVVAGSTVDARSIMQCYSPDQVPVLSALARSYAVCDRWFASAPCQTWPNRAFVHAGTSCGRVNNLDSIPDSDQPPDPKYYDVPTIFNVLEELNIPWRVYTDNSIPTLPSLTRYQFADRLWPIKFGSRFCSFGTFKDDSKNGSLPAYSFVEPAFVSVLGQKASDQHPPHDVSTGEAFLYEVWQAVRTGARWNETLLLITYDEHGGCYDHVSPPAATPPGDGFATQAGYSFMFDRYGVRVPAVVVCPWVEQGTVFRANAGGREFDHTSILATLRDWLDLNGAAATAQTPWLTSRRIRDAPTLGAVLTLNAARTDTPSIPAPKASAKGAPPQAPKGFANTLEAAAMKRWTETGGTPAQIERLFSGLE